MSDLVTIVIIISVLILLLFGGGAYINTGYGTIPDKKDETKEDTSKEEVQKEPTRIQDQETQQ